MTNSVAASTNLVIGPDLGDFTIYSYINEDHTLDEMMTNRYFSNVRSRLRKRDYIILEDAKAESALVRVADCPPDGRVILERVLAINFAPLPDAKDDEYIIAWKGPRGGYFHILKNGESVASDFRTRPLAEHEVEQMKRAAKAA